MELLIMIDIFSIFLIEMEICCPGRILKNKSIDQMIFYKFSNIFLAKNHLTRF